MNKVSTRVDACENAKCFASSSFLAGLLGVAAILPVAVHAQTLDEAIEAQLGYDLPSDLVCFELRNGDSAPVDYLTGQLNAICSRGGPSGGAGPGTDSTGGDAGTPAALPSIVQQRMRETGGKETETEASVPAASPDAVVELGGGLSLFASGEFKSLNRDDTTFEAGYDSHIWRAVAGADYRFTDRILAGLALDYYHHDGSFDGGGGFDNNSYGFLAFGSFLPVDRVFVQFSAGYARKTYDRNRFGTYTETNLNGSPSFQSNPGAQNDDYNADEARASALVSYDHPIGNVTIGPRAGFDFHYIDFGTHSEDDGGITGLALTFHDDDQTSLQSRLGVQASVAFTTGLGVVVPQAGFDWMHEFENDQRNVEVSFVDDTRGKRFTYQTASPDRNWFEVNAGIVAVLPNGSQVFGNYRTMLGHDFFDSHAGTIGIRLLF